VKREKLLKWLKKKERDALAQKKRVERKIKQSERFFEDEYECL